MASTLTVKFRMKDLVIQTTERRSRHAPGADGGHPGGMEIDHELQTETWLYMFRCSDYANWSGTRGYRFASIDRTKR